MPAATCRTVIATLAAALAWSPPAAAHGPCRCTWPAVASPGSELRTASGYRAIWNPRPSDFAHQTTPVELAGGHRPDAPTRTVLRGSRSHPRRRMVVRVPRATPPGIYFLLVFDGSEGGAHTTWDYVQVPGRAPAAATSSRATIAAPARPGRPRTAEVAVIAALGGILAGALLARRSRPGRPAR